MSKKLKQGEVDTITNKSIGGSDSKEFKASGIEGTKEAEAQDQTEEKRVVRGEDVIKILREKGVHI